MSFLVSRRIRQLYRLFNDWEPRLRGLWELDDLPRWGPEDADNVCRPTASSQITEDGEDEDDVDMHTDYGDEGDKADNLGYLGINIQACDVGLDDILSEQNATRQEGTTDAGATHDDVEMEARPNKRVRFNSEPHPTTFAAQAARD